MSLTVQLGIALTCLSAAFLVLAILSWYQGDRLKALEKRVKKIEDDRKESKGSVLYTRPLPVQPDSDRSNAVDGGELRRPRRVDRKRQPEQK